MMCQSFSSPLHRVVPYILVHDQRSIFQDRINISHTNSMYYPHKRHLDALLKVGVIIKVIVFRTLCCVVARITLATDCCCCWSIRSAPRCGRWARQARTRKKMYFERYSPGILRLLIYGAVDKIKLGKTLYFQIGVIICPKTINIYCKKTNTVLR